MWSVKNQIITSFSHISHHQQYSLQSHGRKLHVVSGSSAVHFHIFITLHSVDLIKSEACITTLEQSTFASNREQVMCHRLQWTLQRRGKNDLPARQVESLNRNLLARQRQDDEAERRRLKVVLNNKVGLNDTCTCEENGRNSLQIWYPGREGFSPNWCFPCPILDLLSLVT